MSQWSWGFYTVPRGNDPRDLRFRSLFVGVGDVWKEFDRGMGPYLPGVMLAHVGSSSLWHGFGRRVRPTGCRSFI